MRVGEVMSRDVEWIGSDATVQEAAEKMKELDVGPLLICENDRLIGTVTESDLAIRSSAEGRGPTEIPIRDVMKPGIQYCFDYAPVGEAVLLMEGKQVSRLVVIDSTRTMVGTVSLGDLAVAQGTEAFEESNPEDLSIPSA